MAHWILQFGFLYLSSLSPYTLVENQHSFAHLDGRFNNGYPEEKYNEVIKVVQSLYAPLIEQQGGELRILSDWTDGAVNAWAWRMGDEYWLELPGGMSRYHLINEEAFLATICHELGHLLGGAPQNGVISLEGQSDYYSTQECLRLLLSNIQPYKELPENSVVKKLCEKEVMSSICERSLKGALSVTSYFAEIPGDPFPQIETPDQTKVSRTSQRHPKAQCRLDTLVSGFFKKQRPGCWYKN